MSRNIENNGGILGMGITNVNDQTSAYGAAFRDKPIFLMSVKETEAFFNGKMRRNMELREDTARSAAIIHTAGSILSMRFLTGTKAARSWI